MSYHIVKSTSFQHSFPLGLSILLIVGVTLMGCDSNEGGMDASESATVSGMVTDNNSSSSGSARTAASTSSSRGGVEGATVTAVSVGADGTTRPLDGEATTDTNGEFTITVEGEGASNVVRLNAEGENDFSSSVIVDVDGRGQVEAQPMTVETKGEADVYVEAKGEDEASRHDEGVTAADVAFYVNADAAADINAGQTPAAEVAAAVASSVEAENQANSEAEGGADAIAEAKTTLYGDLQSSLATASSADARAQAVTEFEDGMANLYAEAGASEESEAESRQTSTSIMIEFSAEASSDAGVALRRQAELLRAEATARAEEAIFEAQGASSATMDALVNARQQLTADIRTATSINAMVEAHSTYQAEVKTQMEGVFEVSADAISSAESEIAGNVDALFSALADIGGVLKSAAEVAINSYSTFYADAQAAAQASFESEVDSDATAEAAARALVFVSAQGYAS